MPDSCRYAEVMAFVRDGFLAVVSEDEAKKTVEFHVPSKRRTDDEGRITSWSVVWIDPDFNVQFCHYYDNPTCRTFTRKKTPPTLATNWSMGWTRWKIWWGGWRDYGNPIPDRSVHSREDGYQDPLDATWQVLFDLLLPDPDDFPAQPPQFPEVPAVSCTVACDLLLPLGRSFFCQSGNLQPCQKSPSMKTATFTCGK